MQSVLKLIYPDQCITCGALVDGERGLCGACWLATPFLIGLCCDACSQPLLGEAAGARPLCDECLAAPRPWQRGVAVMAYRDHARRIVLSLKHGDRIDLARPAGKWMAERAGELAGPGRLIVPVPLHWTRLVRRRYNQAALLAREIARSGGGKALPDGLIRTRATAPHEDMNREARIANVTGAIKPHPRRLSDLKDARVVLVDDVMTSGATLAAAALAALAGGARTVDVLVLARVVKD